MPGNTCQPNILHKYLINSVEKIETIMDILNKLEYAEKFNNSIKSLGQSAFGISFEVHNGSVQAHHNGKPVILAGTNNYLGLTFDQDCIQAGVHALKNQGTGTTGSRLANGTYRDHVLLEKQLSNMYGADSTVVFTTGYVSNLGTISTLCGPENNILLDADCHASIYEGAKLSGATIYRFKHNDPADLDKKLKRISHKASTMVIVESLYSMFGDFSPLKEFCDVCEKHGAVLMLDDAHSFGIMGDNGLGLAEHLGVLDRIDFITGTFSKSLGTVGGFLTSVKHNVDALRTQIKSYMFTASGTPATIACSRTALQHLCTRHQLRTDLWSNIHTLYSALQNMNFEIGAEPSPVIAVIMPDPKTAHSAWEILLENGVYVNLVVPPGAPKNTCLLRCSMTAAHSKHHINKIIGAFSAVEKYLTQQQAA